MKKNLKKPLLLAFMLLGISFAFAQRQVTGTVIDDATGETLPFVTILVKGTPSGATTSLEGTFAITVPSDESVLVFNFMGYETLELPVPAGGSMDVRMKVLTTTLKGVVITGYQTLSRERVTGAFGKVSQDVLKSRLEPNIGSKLEGAIPGVFVNPDGSIASIRGVSSLNATTAPLFVVDGFPVEDINQVNPNDIESITVLKDASAASIYGVRGSNGVIVVATRKGSQGKTVVDANSSFFITPIPNYKNHNLMNSSQLVDFQQEMFHIGTNGGGLILNDNRYAKPLALEALLAHQNGAINDEQLNAELNRLRGVNNTDQVKDLLLRPKMEQRHSVSARGGNDKQRFYTSLDYNRSNTNELKNHNDAVNINLKTEIDLAKWVTVDASLFAQFKNEESLPQTYGLSYLGYGSLTSLPYNMLKDETGNLIPTYRQRSQSEIDRLVGLGLYDETSNPLTEMDRMRSKNTYTLIRAQGGFTFRLMEGLNLKVGYQTERDNTYTKTVYDENSYTVRRDVNDATAAIPNANGSYKRYRPEGGDLRERRANQNDWTLRAQFNFDRTFTKKHAVTAIAGTEWRSENLYITNTYRMGYDDQTLLFKSFDVTQLLGLTGTQALSGQYNYSEIGNNNFSEVSHRYVSFYGNGAYTYDGKYALTFSARYDDADMLGAAQSYLPMWSVGGKWTMTSEKFMKSFSWLNMLDFRMTYGLTGNVNRDYGPFLQIRPQENVGMGGIVGYTIAALANENLRWERTDVFNVGFDFAVLHNRLNGSIEFYNRKSTDLLAMRAVDPSIGAPGNMVMMNFGSLYNRGFELGLNSVNIKTKDFSWQTMFNFSYNKNKVTNIEQGEESLITNTNNNGIYKVGAPMGALYSFQWAGLHPADGSIMIYDQNGDLVQNIGGVSNLSDDIGHLVYSGTKVPKWTIGFSNTFTYKRFSLAVQIVANGGHVMRDVLPGVDFTQTDFEQNMDSRVMNFWRKSGDEATAVMPAPLFSNPGGLYAYMWNSNTNNVLKADYIRVRNITLGYDIPNDVFGQRMFTSARATFQVTNPFLWVRNSQGINPEISYSRGSEMNVLGNPMMPCYMIGLNLTF